MESIVVKPATSIYDTPAVHPKANITPAYKVSQIGYGRAWRNKRTYNNNVREKEQKKWASEVLPPAGFVLLKPMDRCKDVPIVPG